MKSCPTLEQAISALRTVDTIPSAIVIVDADGIVRFANAAAADLVDMEAGMVVGRSIDDMRWSIRDEEGLPLDPRKLPAARVLAGESVIRGVRHTIGLRNGGRRLLEIDASAIRDTAGTIRGVAAEIRDVTTSVREQHFLRIERELLIRLSNVENTPELQDAVLDEIHAIPEVASCAILLGENESSTFRLVAHRGIAQDLADYFARVGAPDAMTRRFVGQLPFIRIRLADILSVATTHAEESGHRRRPPLVPEATLLSALAVIPFRHKGRFIGGLTVRLREGFSFDQAFESFLTAIGVWLGSVVERIRTQADLAAAHRQVATHERALEDANTALRVLVATTRQDAQEKLSRIRNDIQRLLSPLLREIRENDRSRSLPRMAETLEINLSVIAGEETPQTNAFLRSMTVTEREVLTMIRLGRSSKEIAQELGISVHTVAFHRRNIRYKLGIEGSGRSLSTELHRVFPE